MQPTSRLLARKLGPRTAPHSLDLTSQPSYFGASSGPTRLGWLRREEERVYLEYLRKEEFGFAELKKHRRPFTPPSPTQFIQLRTTSHQGDHHPLSRKITASFNVSSLPLSSPEEQHRFRLLVGSRRDARTDIVTMSEESQSTLEANERRLSETLGRLLAASRAEEGQEEWGTLELDERRTRAKEVKERRPRKVAIGQWPVEWNLKQGAEGAGLK